MKVLIQVEIKKSDFLKLSRLPSNEWIFIEDDGKYYLHSSSLESLSSVADVYWPATELLQKISALAMIHFQEFPRLKPHVIVQVDEEGNRKGLIPLSFDGYLDTSEAYLELEGGQDVQQNFNLESWFILAEQDEAVKNVFRILYNFDQNWINLYKIYEIVRADFGRKNFNNWVQSEQIEKRLDLKKEIKFTNFTHTANSVSVLGDDARHAKPEKPPDNPMSLSEAQLLIRTFLKNWLDWKSQQQKLNLP